MRIIERPFDSSAFCANSRAIRAAPVPAHAVLRQHQVVDRGHKPVADPPDRDVPEQRARGPVDVVEAGELDGDRLRARLEEGEPGLHVTEVEVPPAGTRVAEPVAESAARHHQIVGPGVDEHGLEVRVLLVGVLGEVGGGEELAGPERPVGAGLERDEVGQVGVLLRVAREVGRLPVDEELLEDHVAHRHRQRPVGAGRDRQPLVGELHVVGVVGRDHDDLLAAVAGLGHPVGVRGAGHRHVGAPHDQVARVPPVAGLRDVGLVAEHLRRGDRQVGVPVVEAQHRAPDQRGEPGARGVRDHRHRGDRREAGDPVGAPLPDRVHVGGGDHLGGLVPAGADQAALAAGGLVGLGALRVVDDVRPGLHRVSVVL
jgi:hypothetical protein